jgi:hypothetical protein
LQVNADTQTKADVTIMTAEGDKVTLSASTALHAMYTSYDMRGRVSDQRVAAHSNALQLTSSQQTTVTVEGDLSEAELADIQHLLGSLEEMVGDFLAGDLDGVMSQALSTDNLDSLAGFDATFVYTQQVTVEQRYTAQGMVSQVPVTSSPARITGQSVQHLLDRMLKAVRESQADPEKLAKKLPKFATRLMEKFADEHGLEAPKSKLARHLLPEFLRRFDDFARTADA